MNQRHMSLRRRWIFSGLCALAGLALLTACKPDSFSGRNTTPLSSNSAVSAGASPLLTPSVTAVIEFWPDPAQTLDRTRGFEFGARITFNAPLDSIAHIAAFPLYPAETPADCLPQIPTDRPFWAVQQAFAIGRHDYRRSFSYTDTPNTDRLVIQASVIDTGSIGQVLACKQMIYRLTTSSAPTPTPAALPDSTGSWSPDGRYFATSNVAGGLVGEVNGQRVFSAAMASGVQAWRWTSDSRFAIFRWRHPHNNSYTYVFDTQTWNLIWSTPGCRFTGTADLLGWENCGDYAVAVSPTAPRFLMMNGKLIDLPEARRVALLPDRPVGQRSIPDLLPQGEAAAWSPDGSALAFVVRKLDPPGFALYSARGDGAQVNHVTSLVDCPKSLQWSPDSKQVAVTTGPCEANSSTSLRYVLDRASRQLHVEQISAQTLTPSGPESVATATARWATAAPGVNASTIPPPPTAQPVMPTLFPAATP